MGDTCQCAQHLIRDYNGCRFAVVPLNSILSHSRMYDTVVKPPKRLPWSALMLGGSKATHITFQSSSDDDEENEKKQEQKQDVVVISSEDEEYSDGLIDLTSEGETEPSIIVVDE